MAIHEKDLSSILGEDPDVLEELRGFLICDCTGCQLRLARRSSRDRDGSSTDWETNPA